MSILELSKYFVGVAAKRLSAVEVHGDQHEFNGVQQLRNLLGKDKREFVSRFVYLGENEEPTIAGDDTLTWYDSRVNKTHRSPEYRLYYRGNAALDEAKEGDLLAIARQPGDSLLVIIAKQGSTAENQVMWLCGVEDPAGSPFTVRDLAAGREERQGYAARVILDQLGILAEDSPATSDDVLLEEINKCFDREQLLQGIFPATKIFSDYTRGTLSAASSPEDPDAALMECMEREERLFRIIEKQHVSVRLREGFGDDVDEFVGFALKTINRRKSRVGYALENHLEWIFRNSSLRYSYKPRTESNAQPDFIFPGIEDYRNDSFPASRLSMLGVKYSCKDRWRQITTEAERIGGKHLATMEPAISENQTEEMKAQCVVLVVPKGLHGTYKDRQRRDGVVISLHDFIDLLRERERALGGKSS